METRIGMQYMGTHIKGKIYGDLYRDSSVLGFI